MEIYDGNTMSFLLPLNGKQTEGCQSNLQKFVFDTNNFVRPDAGISMLLAAQTAGVKIRVLPSQSGTCVDGAPLISTIVFED